MMGRYTIHRIFKGNTDEKTDIDCKDVFGY